MCVVHTCSILIPDDYNIAYQIAIAVLLICYLRLFALQYRRVVNPYENERERCMQTLILRNMIYFCTDVHHDRGLRSPKAESKAI